MVSKIYWVSNITGKAGMGELIDDECAIKVCKDMNQKYPMIEHTAILFNGENKHENLC